MSEQRVCVDFLPFPAESEESRIARVSPCMFGVLVALTIRYQWFPDQEAAKHFEDQIFKAMECKTTVVNDVIHVWAHN